MRVNGPACVTRRAVASLRPSWHGRGLSAAFRITSYVGTPTAVRRPAGGFWPSTVGIRPRCADAIQLLRLAAQTSPTGWTGWPPARPSSCRRPAAPACVPGWLTTVGQYGSAIRRPGWPSDDFSREMRWPAAFFCFEVTFDPRVATLLTESPSAIRVCWGAREMEESVWRLCSSGPFPESLQLTQARKHRQPGRFASRTRDRPVVRAPSISWVVTPRSFLAWCGS